MTDEELLRRTTENLTELLGVRLDDVGISLQVMDNIVVASSSTGKLGEAFMDVLIQSMPLS